METTPYNADGSYKKYVITYMPAPVTEEDYLVRFFKTKKEASNWMMEHICKGCKEEALIDKYGPFGTGCGAQWELETIYDYVHSVGKSLESFNPVDGWYFPKLKNLKTKVTRDELFDLLKKKYQPSQIHTYEYEKNNTIHIDIRNDGSWDKY
jgi:hypothetical protein